MILITSNAIRILIPFLSCHKDGRHNIKSVSNRDITSGLPDLPTRLTEFIFVNPVIVYQRSNAVIQTRCGITDACGNPYFLIS